MVSADLQVDFLAVVQIVEAGLALSLDGGRSVDFQFTIALGVGVELDVEFAAPICRGQQTEVNIFIVLH